MTVNPFDDESGQFYVVVNDDGQHAIWPALSAVPRGWRKVVGPWARQGCLNYIEEHWAV